MLDPRDDLDIRALYAEYNRAIDAGEASAWADTFTEDGAFHHPTRTFSGRAQLEAFIADRAGKLAAHPVGRQRHWNDAIAIDGADDAASGRCLLLVAGVARDTGKPVVVAVGRYVDELVKSGPAWRFRQRTLTLS